MNSSKNCGLNNKGASLIMVIVSFAFIAMLGTIVLTAAFYNLQMKQINEKSKQNFYNTEAALDEIKVGLSEVVADCLASSYKDVLERYSATPEANRDSLFEANFIVAMSTIFLSGSTETKFNDYLKETKLNETTGNGAVVSGNPTWSVTPGDSIVFKDVVVINMMDGYKTTVTTDIKIVFPSVAVVSTEGVLESRPYLNYALIANSGLWITTSGHIVSGNIYAGSNGINISNVPNQLSIDHCMVITPGDITVKDKAQLIVGGTDSEVWARNIVTDLTVREATLVNTVIDIDGSTYVQDDLVINAYNSKVTLSGEYYGYSNGFLSNGNSSSDPKDSSAIMINAANAILNLSGLSELRLAGRAFINLDKLNYDINAAVGADTNSNSNILTGESITIKGAQTPYLVPAEFIAVGHNPVTWLEYGDRYDTTTQTDGMVDKNRLLASDIFVNDLVSSEQAKFSYYLNATTPVKRAFYKFVGNENVVYYYLNFKNEELATLYFKNYNLCYHDKIYNGFDIGSVLVNGTVGSVMTSGNLITYDGDDVQVTAGDTKKYINNYASKYDNLIHTLQKNVTSTKSIFENIVNLTKVETDTNATTKQVYKLDDASGYVNIINNDDKDISDDHIGSPDNDAYAFSETGKSGIILATGDVVLNTSFTGMIIAGGDVFLQGGANFSASPSLVNQILMDHTDICRYFNDLTASTGQDEDWKVINVSSLIEYENWRKN